MRSEVMGVRIGCLVATLIPFAAVPAADPVESVAPVESVESVESANRFTRT